MLCNLKDGCFGLGIRLSDYFFKISKSDLGPQATRILHIGTGGITWTRNPFVDGIQVIRSFVWAENKLMRASKWKQLV